MDVGIGLPSTIRGTTREQLLEWARRAEARGFSSLGTIDRIAYGNYEPLVALAAAVLIALQLAVTHWFYLYLVWFAPLVFIALLTPEPDAGSARSSPHAAARTNGSAPR